MRRQDTVSSRKRDEAAAVIRAAINLIIEV